ncbi:MAG TPA: PAS-domain containing protein [Caulobacteraceae bacterium]|jgi:signal transduction histidine kinase|nr:PAS-domain containing protein [Caulobacteraceae bacterium]
MAVIDAAFAAAGGATSLALAATLWALTQRRRAVVRIRELSAALQRYEGRMDAAHASAEAFDSAVVAVEGGSIRLASGHESLVACGQALGLGAAQAEDPAEVVQALMRSDPENARRLKALFERGEPCDFEARPQTDGKTARSAVVVEGRTAGALAWLRLSVSAGAGLPSAARFAAFLDAQPNPAWISTPSGRLVWANRAWLGAADAVSVEEALRTGRSWDRGVESLAAEAAGLGQRREGLRWAPVAGRRRAFQVAAQPLEGGGAGAIALDVTEAEETRESLKRQAAAHDETLNRLADAVAIFGPQRRLAFHNTAFAELWGLEPAWLAEGPTHGEVLDRLRQRRRLPESADYAKWKAHELGFYETLAETPDELWSLPDGRTLRVVRQPHPFGGLLLLFSDITGELRLRAQYNGLVQVQQATLDKLNDAVAVFGSDGRLRLHNEAFERFWGLTPQAMTEAGDFDRVAELCTHLVHDRQFWRDLKARVGDPDPQGRKPVAGETRTSDDRVIAFQTRPLPDGATLIAFDDITATRSLEQALADRSAALTDAERLKRDFVGNVSYELRTPLTTIIGYSELLESQGEALPDRSRAYVAAVRSAASQLAGSINDVLDMAQIDAGEMGLTLGDVRVETLMEQAAARAQPTATEAGVEIAVETPDGEVGMIRADERRLAQALDHLVMAAVRTAPRGGRVTLDARRTLGAVQMRVTDTGRGIPFHVQAHIFDRFVGRDRGGPGLGLALVKALVELHGGWVSLESEPGHGATFTCHLPEAAFSGAAHPELSFG